MDETAQKRGYPQVEDGGTRFDLECRAMFIQRLLNQGNAPLLEQTLRFTTARQRLLAENIVNASTPGYQQKDLSIERFQQLLSRRVEQRRLAPPGSVGFDDVKTEVQNPVHSILFHDGNNRSMEQLMTEQAKNAMMHNLAVELMRRQFSSLENALRERIQ